MQSKKSNQTRRNKGSQEFDTILIWQNHITVIVTWHNINLTRDKFKFLKIKIKNNEFTRAIF